MRKLAILLSFLFIYNFVFATQDGENVSTQDSVSQEQKVSAKVPVVQFRMFADFNVNPFYWEI